MLCIRRKAGERFIIGTNVVVTIRDARGGYADIGVEAPRSIDVTREELLDDGAVEMILSRIKEGQLPATDALATYWGPVP